MLTDQNYVHKEMKSRLNSGSTVFCASDSLQAGWSGDQIPVGARLSAPIQTGPGTHPASNTMGTGSFLGVKQLECGADHPFLSSIKVKERVELYLCSPSGPSWPVQG